MLKKLGKYLKGLGFLAFLSALGMIVESICELALPSLANNIYETVNVATTPEDAKAYVLKMGFAMLGLACIGLCGGIGTMKASAIVSQRFAYRLRNDVYKKISNFSFRNIDEFSTASLTTRLTNDITMLQNVVMMSLRILVRGPALLVVAAVMAVRINPKMSATLLIMLPIIIVIVALIMKFGFPMFQKMQKKVDNVNRVVQENLIGMRVVKAFVREEHEKDKFHNSSDELAKQGAMASGLIVTVMPVMMLLFNAVIVFTYYKGALSANEGVMQVGQISVFASYVVQILMNLVMISMMLLQLARVLGKTEEEVEAQIRLYEETGIIKGYRAMIDKNKAKMQTVTALIEIRVQPKFGHGFDEIANRIAQLEEVESIYLMSGGFDLCCMVSDKSFEEIALFVANRLSPLDGVMSTATHFILKKYKEQGVFFTEAPKDDRGIFSF